MSRDKMFPYRYEETKRLDVVGFPDYTITNNGEITNTTLNKRVAPFIKNGNKLVTLRDTDGHEGTLDVCSITQSFFRDSFKTHYSKRA